jgi:hypothetical protein
MSISSDAPSWVPSAKASLNELSEGQVCRAWHPFMRQTFQPFPEPVLPGDWAGLYVTPPEVPTWVPGWRYEDCGPEDVEEVWDGEGEQLRTIVSIHKPGRYPTRVFYTRQWRDPDGKVFGKPPLRMTTMQAFRTWLSGDRWPSYAPCHTAHTKWAAAQ